MPKRTWHKSKDVEILGENEIKKIQKLAKQNEEEQDVQLEKPNFQLNLFDEEDQEVAFDNVYYNDDDNGEGNAEWKEYFDSSSKEICSDFAKNLKNVKNEVEIEMSEFCGSIPGDLDGIDLEEELPDEIKQHLRLLKDVLKHYRSGPLPKTIKVLPNLPGWDGILEMIDPFSWTCHAMQKVTKVFACKGNDPCLYFYERFLLPKVQENIAECKKLSVHLFEALITAMFRPQEFLSGIFVPWIQGDMTKTEGVVLGHVMKKNSFKNRFAAVAIALLADEKFSIPRSIVLLSLLEKKYNLPEPAIQKLVQYFTRMDNPSAQYHTTEGRLPISWFKSLLIFLENYHGAILPDERSALVSLLRRHNHPAFDKDIRGFISLIPLENKI